MTQKMDLIKFGDELLSTGDLDPVYVLLWDSDLDGPKLARWLIGYWCYYHVGVASFLSELKHPDAFWRMLCYHANRSDMPRGTERRHFRGDAAKKASDDLKNLGFTPDQFCTSLGNPDEDPITLVEFMGRVKQHRGFGPWIAFKVADMYERLSLCPIVFTEEDIFSMFDAPVKGAEAAWDRYHVDSHSDACSFAYDYIIDQLGTRYAPPRNERRINIQEVETILCKWKSHLNGHYEVGKDIREIRHALLDFGRYKTAQHLLKAGKGGLW